MSAPKLSAPGVEFISVREFARRAGCDDRQVRRALARGRLSRNSAGFIDSAQLAGSWRSPNKRTTAQAKPIADDGAKLSARAGADNCKLSALDRDAAVVRTLSAPTEGEPLSSIDDAALETFADQLLQGRYASINDALRIKENALAMKHLLAARREAGLLIEVEVAENVLFEASRSARDSWIGWPSRVAPMMAMDLGIEDGPAIEKLRVSLEEYVHTHLVELGSMKPHPAPFDPPT